MTATAPVELTVVPCPEKHLAFTNYVYCSPTETTLLKNKRNPNYVIINNVVYTIESHATLTSGQLGLSSPQRDTLKVGQGGKVQARPFAMPGSGQSTIVRILMNCELVGQGRKTLTEKEVGEHMAATFNNGVFNVGQVFITDYIGTALKMTVKELELPHIDHSDAGSDGVTMRAERGVLNAETTEIEVDSEPPNKYLTFVKEKKKSFIPKNFKFEDMGIGGLDAEFNTIFRRAFASRILPLKLVQQLGIKHVKGMLLYGPPGTGKTLIARQIGKMLATREPKIVNGPEVLNKFVGQSEENIRKLFQDAEEDQKQNGDSADLHMIIFDEIDAICKARGAKSGGDSGVGDTVVNQLLSKMDGVNSLNNILVIGMTNRKDLIDPALLRPGRLEVHIEISLPDEKGRLQILNIHTKTMKENNRLGKDVDLVYLARETKNFSGAEIEGLVKSATSFALYNAVDIAAGQVGISKEKEKDIRIDMAAFMHAMGEVKPSFGVDEDELTPFIGELYDYGENFHRVLEKGRGFVEQVRNTQRQRIVPILLSGPVGSGKTTIAAKLAKDSGFPFVRMIRPSQFLGMTELGKTSRITQIFEDAYKSPISCIVIDSLENLIEYIPVGPRFSNSTLQALIAFCSQPPPHPSRKLLVFATTNKPDMVRELGFEELFQQVTVSALQESEEVKAVLDLLAVEVDGGEQAKEMIALSCPMPMGIKTLLNKIDFYTHGNKASPIGDDIWKVTA